MKRSFEGVGRRTARPKTAQDRVRLGRSGDSPPVEEITDDGRAPGKRSARRRPAYRLVGLAQRLEFAPKGEGL